MRKRVLLTSGINKPSHVRAHNDLVENHALCYDQEYMSDVELKKWLLNSIIVDGLNFSKRARKKDIRPTFIAQDDIPAYRYIVDQLVDLCITSNNTLKTDEKLTATQIYLASHPGFDGPIHLVSNDHHMIRLLMKGCDKIGLGIDERSKIGLYGDFEGHFHNPLFDTGFYR